MPNQYGRQNEGQGRSGAERYGAGTQPDRNRQYGQGGDWSETGAQGAQESEGLGHSSERQQGIHRNDYGGQDDVFATESNPQGYRGESRGYGGGRSQGYNQGDFGRGGDYGRGDYGSGGDHRQQSQQSQQGGSRQSQDYQQGYSDQGYRGHLRGQEGWQGGQYGSQPSPDYYRDNSSQYGSYGDGDYGQQGYGRSGDSARTGSQRSNHYGSSGFDEANQHRAASGQGNYGQGSYGQRSYAQGGASDRGLGGSDYSRNQGRYGGDQEQGYGQQAGRAGYGQGNFDGPGRFSTERNPGAHPYSQSFQGGYGGVEGTGPASGKGLSQFRDQAGSQRKGPKGYQRSDDRLKEDICERLTHSYHLDVSEVSVEVRGGKVTLEGSVPDRHTKFAIEDLVDSAWGVQDVDNRIRVSRQSDSSASTAYSSAQSSEQSGQPASAGGVQSATQGGLSASNGDASSSSSSSKSKKDS